MRLRGEVVDYRFAEVPNPLAEAEGAGLMSATLEDARRSSAPRKRTSRRASRRAFRVFMAGSVVSWVGDWMDLPALNWAVLELTGLGARTSGSSTSAGSPRSSP